MSMFMGVIVSGLQIPAPGYSVAEARELAVENSFTGVDLPAEAEESAKAVQDQQTGPATSTPEATENGEASTVNTQLTQQGA